MIPPKQHWCIQIDVTNQCPRKCSNCTRSLAHVTEPFNMTVDTFRAAVEALADFPTKSESNSQNNGVKVVGIIGGEPACHPEFWHLERILYEAIPDRQHRGLWTSDKFIGEDTYIRRAFGYVNYNPHSPPSKHHPILVAIKDIVPNHKDMWQLIDKCPYQTTWSSSITPKGFFFCEVAAALDMVFQGPGGLPIEPGCWKRPLDDFRSQIERWCPRCGGSIPFNKGRHRLDNEERDDVSMSNLVALKALHSPRIKHGNYFLFNPRNYTVNEELASNPLDYMAREKRYASVPKTSIPAPPYKP